MCRCLQNGIFPLEFQTILNLASLKKNSCRLGDGQALSRTSKKFRIRQFNPIKRIGKLSGGVPLTRILSIVTLTLKIKVSKNKLYHCKEHQKLSLKQVRKPNKCFSLIKKFRFNCFQRDPLTQQPYGRYGNFSSSLTA